MRDLLLAQAAGEANPAAACRVIAFFAALAIYMFRSRVMTALLILLPVGLLCLGVLAVACSNALPRLRPRPTEVLDRLLAWRFNARPGGPPRHIVQFGAGHAKTP